MTGKQDKLKALEAQGITGATDPEVDRKARALCVELGPALDRFVDGWLEEHGAADNSAVRLLVRINLWVESVGTELVVTCASRGQLETALDVVLRTVREGALHAFDELHRRRAGH